MTKAGEKIIEGMAEALSIAKGEQPAARIFHKGHAYVPEQSWQPIETAPKDGTHILAILHREATADCEGRRWPAFSEAREIWYQPFKCPIFGDTMPWHAGDPCDSNGTAPDHFGEDVPTHWMPLPPPPGRETGE